MIKQKLTVTITKIISITRITLICTEEDTGDRARSRDVEQVVL